MSFLFELTGYINSYLVQHSLLAIGFLLLMGYFFGYLATLIRLPEISGFIFAGILVNSFTTGMVSAEMNESLHVVTEVAIGLLALSIGSEFSIKKLRRIGKHIVVITAFQFLFTLVMVTGAMRLLGMAFPYAFILAVTACASAPAIIVAEVHHLRAYGKFIDYVFGSVVLIDALCVILFGVAFTLVTNYLNIAGTSPLLGASLREIGISLLLGALSGVLIHLFTTKKTNESRIFIIMLSVFFTTTGLSLVLHLSPLLLNIVAGSVLASLSVRNHRLFKMLEPLTPPVYALFFVIAGIEINPGIFLQGSILLLAAGYFFSRFLGKYAGAWAGCRVAGMEPEIRDHLGLCMMSQAGIALGFVLLIQTSPIMTAGDSPQAQRLLFINMMNIVLISIFVNEVIGPVISRYAIIKGNSMEE
jgi:Kef-type K+ transport system membrane component KefB